MKYKPLDCLVFGPDWNLEVEEVQYRPYRHINDISFVSRCSAVSNNWYIFNKFMKYKPLDCLAFGPDWKKSSIVLLDILMIFQPFVSRCSAVSNNCTYLTQKTHQG